MKKYYFFWLPVVVFNLFISCASQQVHNNALTREYRQESSPRLFNFIPLSSKTRVVENTDKIIKKDTNDSVLPFADISSIPPNIQKKLVETVGVDLSKVVTSGATIPAYIDGTIVKLDREGNGPWGRYIIIEGKHEYFLGSDKTDVSYHLLISRLGSIKSSLAEGQSILANTEVGTAVISSNYSESTNYLVYTPYKNDVFLNVSTPVYPADYQGNRWFPIITFNDNVRIKFAYPERSPHEVAYFFCHWHDETGAERRDIPPEGTPPSILITNEGLKFSLILENSPYVLNPEQQKLVEQRLMHVLYNRCVAVSAWKDETYTYYLFWGPYMANYIKEEFKPEIPVIISAHILTTDIETQSLVMYVGDFSYYSDLFRLNYMNQRVIKLDE